MHLETLKTFCDLVESGSFSKAAALNFISQSAVSQQVNALERRYGQKLIERGHRRSVILTEAGKLFYSGCKEMLARFGAVEIALHSRAQAIVGTIRVATVYSVGLHELPPYIKRFIKAHPQANVKLEYSRTNRIYEACLNDTIDFGIVAYPAKLPNLEVVPFRDDRLVLVRSPQQGSARESTVSIETLQGAAFVGFEKDIPTRKAIDRLLRRYRVCVNYVMEFDNIETIKRSVEVGIGMSILPETAVAHEAKGKLLRVSTFIEGDFRRPIGFIYRKGKVLNPAASELLAFLASESLS
ncbi:MAG: LysR family transcriptional regulator [Acidobacteriota bacterium]